MNNVLVIVIAFAGLLVGAAFAWLSLRSSSSAVARTENRTGAGTGLGQVATGAAAGGEFVPERCQSQRRSDVRERTQQHEEKLHLLNAASEEMKAQFKSLASTALESNNASFLAAGQGRAGEVSNRGGGGLEKRGERG